MLKRLGNLRYRVIVESTFVVDAKTEQEAMRIAPIAFKEEIDKEIEKYGHFVSFMVWPVCEESK